MAITLKNKSRKPEAGFTLLIAAIFMSVMLLFGITLASLGYKQQVLASLAIESQYAFYAANSALECAHWADLQLHLFPTDAWLITPLIPPSAQKFSCDGLLADSISDTPGAVEWDILERFKLDNDKHCADVLIRKFPPTETDGEKTKIFSQGYNVPCAEVDSGGARRVSRGLNHSY